MGSARGDGSLVKARKGIGGYQLTFDGVAAHDGNEPEKERSAITAFANSVQAINALTDMTRGTTLNMGVVQGRSVVNVVAAELHAQLDVRFGEYEEYDRAHKSLQSLCQQGFLDGVTTTLTRVIHTPAMAASKRHNA